MITDPSLMITEITKCKRMSTASTLYQQYATESIQSYEKKYDIIDTAIFVCSQMVQESLSLFMFLLQVKEKEETLQSLE